MRTDSHAPGTAVLEPVKNRTFQALWRDAVENHTTSPFLLFLNPGGSTTQWSYGEFDQVVDAVAEQLRNLGIGRGDGIHVCLKNSPLFVAVWLASARLGAWFVPVDPSSSSRDIRAQMQRTGVRLGIYAGERREAYLAGAAEFGFPLWEATETPADVDLDALPTPTGIYEEEAVQEQDRLAIMFTSGSTSAPKGVVLTQRNYHTVALEMAENAGLQAAHRWYVTLPLFHGNAQYYCFATAIAAGASVALRHTFSASRWVAEAIETQSTHASLFAAPIRMILARTPEDQEPAALEHLWFAQSLGREHHRQFTHLAGVPPRQLYGMTETITVVSFDRAEEPSCDLIGDPANGRRVRIVEPDTLTPVAAGAVGMIAVAGTPGVDIFLEYLDNPETTARTIVEDPDGGSWLLTGDLAQDTGPGGLRFVGRNDDVIKVSGENVSLTEVESAVAEAPGVLEAVVLAEDDPLRDRVPVAFVVPRDRQDPPTPALLQAWAEQNLAKAARPVRWNVIDELPRSSVGKIRRFKLKTS